MTLGREDGITKLIVDPETDRVLGVAVAGPGAGELIAEGVLAMEMAAVASDLRGTIHPHPTLSETIFEAAEMLFKAVRVFCVQGPRGALLAVISASNFTPLNNP